VWETNHTWLIFCLVILWTCFPFAFASIMSTLFVPLTLAALGIVLRGSAFVFRKVSVQRRYRRLFGAFFALSSVITPFFLGAVAGAVATGRVPLGDAAGQPVSSWVNRTSLAIGVLAVGLCAFTAAILLCRDAQRLGADDLVEWFRTRAIVSGAVCGVLSAGVLVAVATDDAAAYIGEGMRGKALPLLVLSGVAAVAALVLVARRSPAPARWCAAAAVAVVLLGWGTAQYPYLLPTSLTIQQGAAPESTLQAVLVIVLVALAIILPSMYLLFRLDQGSKLEMDTLDEVALANAG
jgi:cytochrome d ubiquinol oxidase subunit II